MNTASRRENRIFAPHMPDPSVRAERERARFRLHLVRHRSSLKQRIRATLLKGGQTGETRVAAGT
jgi:transposase